MEIEETAANPAAVADVQPEEPQVVNLDALEASETEANTPAEGDDSALDDLEALATEPEATGPDEVEVEYEGETFKVPAKLKDAVLRQADYTKKTTEVANQRREVEQQRELVAAASRSVENVAALTVIDQQIKQLQQLDITDWSQDQVNAAELRLLGLQRQAENLTSQITEAQTQQEQHEAAEMAKQREAAIAEASKSIPKFTDERRTELETLAVELGIDADAIKSITTAAEYKVLHYADIGRKFAQRQSQAAKMKAAQAGNPSARVGGVAQAGKPAEEMTMDEYITARNEGRLT